MVFVFILTAIGGVVIDNIFAQIAPLIFSSAYAVILGPGAFSGGGEIDRNKLIEKLDAKWCRADEIADFIVKYWYSIKYIMSAQKRGSNCSLIAIASFILTGWYFYTDAHNWVLAWSILNGIILTMIGNKVNKALFILQHEEGTPQWGTACISFVALAEYMNNDNYAFVVNNMLPQGKVAKVIDTYSKS